MADAPQNFTDMFKNLGEQVPPLVPEQSGSEHDK